LILDAYAALKALFGFARMCEFCGGPIEPLKKLRTTWLLRARRDPRREEIVFVSKWRLANYLGNFGWVGLPFNMTLGLEILEGGSRKWVIVSPGLDNRGKFSAPNS
jgi:hypothetical protein